MKSKKNNSIIFIICFFSLNIYSQIFPTNQELTSRFNSRVKLLDEFIKRFNYSENNKELSGYSKISQFAYLFNLEDKELITKQDAKDFVLLISNDSFTKKLSFYDDDFFVSVNTLYKIKGIEQNIRFILKVRVSDKGYSWVITKIDQVELDTVVNETNINSKKPYNSINPVDNEVNFIQFSELLLNKKITTQNFSNDIDSSLVKLYLSFINSNKNNFEEISRLQYHFFQIENYHFTVDFYLRPSKNSGWLISSLNKINNTQKKDLINKLFE